MTRTLTFLFAVMLAGLIGLYTASAQETAPSTPTLTEVQRLQVLNAAKDVELWQLKAQQAATEFEKARVTLTKLIEAVTPTGYQLNEKLELVKLPEAK